MAILHPGVYVQEISSGIRPIEGVSTSTAAFIGKAEKGPVRNPTLITSIPQFESTFGAYLNDSWLSHAVHRFFNNGGTASYVVRVTGPGAATAGIILRDRRTPAGKTLRIDAVSAGKWANVLDLVVTDGTLDGANEFNLAVYIDHSAENPPLPPELLESFENLSVDESSPDYVEKRINTNSNYIVATVDRNNLVNAAAGSSRSAKLAVGSGAVDLKLLTGPGGATATPGVGGPPPVAGTLRSGDSPSTNPASDKRRFLINLSSDGPQEVLIPGEAATGVDIAAAIQAGVRGLTALTSANQPAFSAFTCSYQTPGVGNPFYLLTSGSAGATSTVAVAEVMVLNGLGATLLGLGLTHGGTETPGAAAVAGVSSSTKDPAINIPAESRRFTINLDGDGPQDVVFTPANPTGTDVATAIQTAVRALVAKTVANQPAYNTFTADFVNAGGAGQPLYRLTSGTTGAGSSVVVTDSMKPAGGVVLPANRSFMIDVNGDGTHAVNLAGPFTGGNAIATAVQAAVRTIVPKRNSNALAFAAFTCAYNNGADAGNPSLTLTSGAPGPNSSVRVTNFSSLAANASSLLGLGTTNHGSEVTGSAVLRPANSQDSTEYHLGDAIAVVGGNVESASLGDDGLPPGDIEHKDGLHALDRTTDVNLVCIPGIGSPDVVSEGINYCTQRMDCFFIGDMNSTDDKVDEARLFVDSLNKTSYGAVYYPWLKVADPTGRSAAPILEPPSGFVAGLYARTDSRRGVWKAPAGTEATVGGALGLSAVTTDAEQDFLNPVGVNVIRSFPASGIVVWGARTVATRNNPEYRYVPVRRTAIFLEQSIFNGIQFAVFEPNDEPLWASLRLNITAFMTNLFRQGAFQGKSASDAFFVLCDSSTTTQQDIDAGVVNILVGFAPLKPAEFVILRLTQKAGAAA